jgi:hypothetical protein
MRVMLKGICVFGVKSAIRSPTNSTTNNNGAVMYNAAGAAEHLPA